MYIYTIYINDVEVGNDKACLPRVGGAAAANAKSRVGGTAAAADAADANSKSDYDFCSIGDYQRCPRITQTHSRPLQRSQRHRRHHHRQRHLHLAQSENNEDFASVTDVSYQAFIVLVKAMIIDYY